MRLIRAALGADGGGMGGAQTGELSRQGTERQARDMQVMDGTGMMQRFWKCRCGQENKDKFCSGCGKPFGG